MILPRLARGGSYLMITKLVPGLIGIERRELGVSSIDTSSVPFK